MALNDMRWASEKFCSGPWLPFHCFASSGFVLGLPQESCYPSLPASMPQEEVFPSPQFRVAQE